MRKPRARHVVLVFLAPVVVAAVACSSMAPPTQPPEPAQAASYQQQAGYAQPGYPPPSASGTFALPNFEEAPAADLPGRIAQLDRAEQALDFVLGISGSTAAEVTTNNDAPKGGIAKSAPVAPGALPLAQGDACSIACAALASMKRSAEHVCTMAGETDAQCGGARARVERAEQRVTAACPACSR